MAWVVRASIAGCALLIAASAAAEGNLREQLVGTTWRAETIMGQPVMDYAASTITFEADGRIHGRGGCNRYFGTITIADGEIETGPLGATKMACSPALDDQEWRFFQALERAKRLKIDERGLLLIYSEGAADPTRLAPFTEPDGEGAR